MRKLALHLSLFTLLVPASVGLASDGVLEINQACAVNTGCFSGDGAGLPVKITASGSYRLTSNLNVPDENTDGIVIGAKYVSIDLNGFAIIGPVTCSGLPPTCSHTSGTGDGIIRLSGLSTSTSVKNGSIMGMGNHGVYLEKQAEVTNLRVRFNRFDGISVSEGSTVSGNTAHANGNVGIRTTAGCTVSGNTAYGNGNNGIYAQSGSTVSGNTVRSNGIDGIGVSWGSTVSGNTAYLNIGDGIEANSGSTVSGNTMRGNEGYGLRFWGSDSAYSENVITNNVAGTVTGSAVQLGQNACNGNTTCP